MWKLYVLSEFRVWLNDQDRPILMILWEGDIWRRVYDRELELWLTPLNSTSFPSSSYMAARWCSGHCLWFSGRVLGTEGCRDNRLVHHGCIMVCGACFHWKCFLAVFYLCIYFITHHPFHFSMPIPTCFHVLLPFFPNSPLLWTIDPKYLLHLLHLYTVVSPFHLGPSHSHTNMYSIMLKLAFIPLLSKAYLQLCGFTSICSLLSLQITSSTNIIDSWEEISV